MGRRKICPECGHKMEKYRMYKEQLPCKECDEKGGRGVRLQWIKVYPCSNCQNLLEVPMSLNEIIKYGKEVSWGPMKSKTRMQEQLKKEMVKVKKENKEMNEILKETDETKLNELVAALQELPKVNRVHITKPRHNAVHLVEMGWNVLELRIVPCDRPPYIECEKTIGKVCEVVYEGISEVHFRKLGDKTYLVPIFEQPVQLPHI